MSMISARSVLAIGLVLAASVGPDPAAQGQGATPPVRRVLAIYSDSSTLYADVDFARGLREALPGEIAIDAEHLDANHHPDPGRLARLGDLLVEKYAAARYDVVVAAGPAAIRFVAARRAQLAPGAAMLAAGVAPAMLADLSPPADAYAALAAYDSAATLDMALALRPDASRIVVLGGASAQDLAMLRQVRDEVGASRGGVPVDYVGGLPMQGNLDLARGLPPDAILLVRAIFTDGDGRTWFPRDAAARIAEVSAAPVYGVYSTFVGAGPVGGVTTPFDEAGAAAGALALRLIRGETVEPRIGRAPMRAVADWPAMERWGLDRDRLPPGARLERWRPSTWESHRGEILSVSAIIVLQGATIAGLVASDRRRRRIEAELAEERHELAHVSRVAQLGALSGAIAHELNQPLTAILANAEAGARLMERAQAADGDAAAADLAEVREILADIAEDDRRAAGIIRELRRLLVRGEAGLVAMDLNQAAAACIALARSAMLAHRAQIDWRPAGPELPVRGNPVQLKQVILNLLVNAAEAMADLPPARRRIVVETRRLADGRAELSVADAGPGLPPEIGERAFDRFVSGKPGGLGLGLAICRSIAQAHGGALLFDDAVRGGARAVLTLPAEGAQA